MYDFNATTGVITNEIILSPNFGGYGVCFSPDNTKLYANEAAAIVQYDLSSGNTSAMVNSRTFLTNPTPTSVDSLVVSHLKLGPDGKIYFLTPPNDSGLGIIHQPNQLGLSCQLELNAINMPTGKITAGLPNTIKIVPSDTIITSQHFGESDCFISTHLLQPAYESTGWNYLWNTGDSSQTLIANAPGLYWVSYNTFPCNTNIDTFRIEGAELPEFNIVGSCVGASNGLAYAHTSSTHNIDLFYKWMDSSGRVISSQDSLKNVAGGNYYLEIQAGSCDTMLQVLIPEVEYNLSFSSPDTLICIGDTLQLTNTSDNHFSSFYWDMGNGDHFSSKPNAYRYTSSGSYRVMLAGEGAICKDTVYQTIVVDAPATPEFSWEPQEVCIGKPITLLAYSDSTTTALDWTFADDQKADLKPESQCLHAFDHAGIFPITLNIRSRACPDTSYTDSINVYPYPEVDLGIDSSICLHGSPLYLKNLRPAPTTPYRRVWSTGDTTEVLEVVHPGIYTLSLTTEPLGCTATESIEIRKDCYIDVPNAFTPNGDGHNDYFFPRQLLSKSVNRFSMQVFNRWGQLIFETDRPNGRGWDGQFNGKAQPTGIYLYRIAAEFSNGNQEHYQGNVTLVR